jgi:hypothetical protein
VDTDRDPMTDIRGTLARLLATENLLVEHRKVGTASFDVQKRILTLPLWDRASNRVYTMLVGHEVGHALFTPADFDPTKLSCPKSFLNVTEDARIEKLMKRKYPGLAKDFYVGYQELNEDDFFRVSEEDLNKLPLIDRINLHYKIGAFAMMPLDASETPLCDAVGAAETFDDAVDAALAIYKHMKEEKEQEEQLLNLEKQSEENVPTQTTQSGGGIGEVLSTEELLEGAEECENADENANEQENANEGTSIGSSSAGGNHGSNDIDEVRTQESFDDELRRLTNTHSRYEPTIVNLPIVDLKKVVVSNDVIVKATELFWSEHYANVKDYRSILFDPIDTEFREFCNRTSKDVNYLVKEFECRKAASASSRATISRTGVLDTNKLQNYKFSDDIFRKISNTPDGKNHGLVFLLDWSGSMSNEIFETVCQLINLCQFCKKVGIPFDVYSFVVDPAAALMNDPELNEVAGKVAGDIYIDKRFRLMNLLTSEGNAKNFTNQCLFVYRIASYYQKNGWMQRGGIVSPGFLCLNGTPLNEGLICINQLLPVWKSRTGAEKTHLIVLTDGEASQSGYVHTPNDHFDRPYVTCLHRYTLRDRKHGRYYSEIPDGHYSTTNILLRVIRDSNPGCSVLGFRICPSRDLSNMLHRVNAHSEKYKKEWSKNKCVVVTNSNYHELYVIQSNSYTEDTSMQIAIDNPTKAQIKSAFTKSLKSKSNNRRLLSSFVGQIA